VETLDCSLDSLVSQCCLVFLKLCRIFQYTHILSLDAKQNDWKKFIKDNNHYVLLHIKIVLLVRRNVFHLKSFPTENNFPTSHFVFA
jgi:hypothetical protein